MNQLTFETIKFQPIEREGAVWLRGGQIALSLHYKDERNFRLLYQRHADEFTPHMTAEVRLPTAGGVQLTRIFSLRGAHMLGMLSKTAPAKRFRQWVLDVLEQSMHPQATKASQGPAPAVTANAGDEPGLLRQLIATQTQLIELLNAKLATPPAPRKRRPPLTPREIALILKLRASGLSVGDIAKEVGRSTATVSLLVRTQIH